MGVSAVPGSGKTQTLSYLAAKLVASEQLGDDQEILIVTLVNSAVNNFSSRVAQFLKQFGLVSGIGYRVRTLHGLAYDIVREHPELVGLDNHFSIADERVCEEILNYCVRAWMKTHPQFFEEYADPNYAYQKYVGNWADLLRSYGSSFINQAKDLQYSADELLGKIAQQKADHTLLQLGIDLFIEYQNSLFNRGAVDFADLIRLALKILQNFPDVLEKLRYRWPFILEDEAQDSSLVQEQLLRLLCGENGNWVRVGDPNQAIYETFTTADPQLLRDFLVEDGVVSHEMKYSGRSSRSIINLANRLITWTNQSHPVEALRDALAEPLIEPTPSGDPQQNPPDEPTMIHMVSTAYKPADELKDIAQSLQGWLEKNPHLTVAVLVSNNERGAHLADELIHRGIPAIELLRSSKSTRDTARILKDILAFYAHPHSMKAYTQAITAILTAQKVYEPNKKAVTLFLQELKKLRTPESLFYDPGYSEYGGSEISLQEPVKNQLESAMQLLSRWQHTVLLPIDQMILTIAMEIFQQGADLALAHKLAIILETASRLYPNWEFPQFLTELESIASNRFRLYGFSDEDLSFDPDQHKGKVVISTIHKAKGLEWDRVYLMSVNNYDFPSAQNDDQYISERWFVRGKINLEAEALSQLRALHAEDAISMRNPEGKATVDARLSYAAERLRLLYVGITRAKRQLVITWNTGKKSNCREALPLESLRVWWEAKNAGHE